MKLAIISFTRQGGALCGRLAKGLRELGHDCTGYIHSRFLNEFIDCPGLCPVREPLGIWTGARFYQLDGLLFIGAAGIAVRAIAPFVQDKKRDPAVVVVDDGGHFAISLLSGHMGGANELTRITAKVIDAVPVITTATDVNGKTALDVWARQRNLKWPDRELLKRISAALLDGQPVGFYSDYPLSEPVPEDFTRGQLCRYQVWITACQKPESRHMVSWFSDKNTQILRLIPKSLYVGVGCRKDTEAAVLFKFLKQVFLEHNLDLDAVAQIASIALKERETGLIRLAARLGVPFQVYPQETLNGLDGAFTPSEFVKSVTGVDNVCERAAIAGAGPDGTMLVPKQAGSGITIAVASRQLEIKRNEI